MKNGLKWWQGIYKTNQNRKTSPTSPPNAPNSPPRRKILIMSSPTRKRVGPTKKEKFNLKTGKLMTQEQACCMDLLLVHWLLSFLSPCGEFRSQSSIAVSH